MIRIVETDREFAELEREWRRLEAETRSSVFSGFDFVHCSWTFLRKPAHRLLLLVSETEGRIDTIAPFFVCRDLYHGIPYRRIGFIASWAGDRPGILTTLPEEAAWRRILDFLDKEVNGWEVIELVEQPKIALRGDGGRFREYGSCYWEETPDGVGYYISLDGSWESYLERIDPKVKSNLRNRMRRLSARPGEFSIERFTKPDEMEMALARYIAVEKSGWKGEAGVGLAKDERHTEFYKRLLVRLAERGGAFVYILRSGRDDLSAAIRFLHQGRLYERHIAYSPAFSEFSPGIVLKTQIIKDWFGTDCDECDMLLVITPWMKKGKTCNPGAQAKIDWATDRRETVSIRGYRYRSRLLPWILGKKAKRAMNSRSAGETE